MCVWNLLNYAQTNLFFIYICVAAMNVVVIRPVWKFPPDSLRKLALHIVAC